MEKKTAKAPNSMKNIGIDLFTILLFLIHNYVLK